MADSLSRGPARNAAQVAHALWHILDDYAAEDAQTGNVTVEIPASDWKELNRTFDLIGDDPHEVLHDLIGVNDPVPPLVADVLETSPSTVGEKP